jgi:hypothetical protein
LHAAVKQPPLFDMKPETIIGNIEGVTKRFACDGLTLKDYLHAAVKQPSLFVLKPETLIGHVTLIIDLHRQGLVTFPGQDDAPSHQPLKPLFNWLVRNPAYFTLAADNFTLREVAARANGLPTSRTELLTRPRHHVERELAEHLGHDDLRTPIAKETMPEDGGDPGRHARNVLLRALVRAGLVKGGRLER